MTSTEYDPSRHGRSRCRESPDPKHERQVDDQPDAQRSLNQAATSAAPSLLVTPIHVVAFQEYAEYWRAIQVHRASTEAYVETMVRRHVYPAFGLREMGTILPSEIQAWVKGLTLISGLAPSTVGVVHGVVSGIFRSAIRDRVIHVNPCDGTRLPVVERRLVVPLISDQVSTLRRVLPDELKTQVTFGAGTGMRQGEVFGVTRDRLRLDGDDPVVVVDRQLRTLPGSATAFGPLKTKASQRIIPLSSVVVAALRAHMATFDVAPDGLVFTLDGRPITRSAFGHVWRPAAKVADLTPATGKRMHALRHYYASLLIRFGESVKTVQARLGHASATETLDTYAHLWPDSGDRTRQAVDAELRG